MLQLDHTVVLVKDLAQAVEDYTRLGFTVSPGGTHAGGISHNSLIHFQDGTFIELLAIRANARTHLLKRMHQTGLLKAYSKTAKYGMAYRFYGRSLDLGGDNPDKEGITDYCLLADHQAGDYQMMENNGVALTPPFFASRMRPDGQEVSWNMYTALDDALPFFRTDYIPQITREPAALQHANGALGTQKTILFAEAYNQTLQSYQQLLAGLPSQKTTDSTVFKLNNGEIEVIDNTQCLRGDVLKNVQAQGIGRFALVMQTENPDFVAQMQHGNTHGVVFL